MARVRRGAGDPAGARDVLREALARSPTIAASLRLCGCTARHGTAPGGARMARGAGEKLPTGCRCTACKPNPMPHRASACCTISACRTYVLQGTLPALSSSSSSHRRAGRRFLSTIRRRGALTGPALAASRGEENSQGKLKNTPRVSGSVAVNGSLPGASK